MVKEKEKSCMTCEHYEQCPIIELWVKLNSPIVIATFFCSEYIKENLPSEKPNDK